MAGAQDLQSQQGQAALDVLQALEKAGWRG